MFRVLNCLTTEHDWRLAGLAVVVCFIASFAAFILLQRARDSKHHTRTAWIAAAGVASGSGFWATHFVAMLAYDPPFPLGYDSWLTALSLVVAIALTTAGLGVATRASGLPHAAAGGAIVGAGIAAMHFIGMEAIDLPGHITWSLDLVIASIVLGTALAAGALAVAQRQIPAGNAIAVLLLALAILTLHFTAMAAIGIFPDPIRQVDALGLSDTTLAFAIAGVTAVVLGLSIIGAVMDRRIERQSVLLDTALNTMTHGLMMFDAQSRVILCNERYLDLYRLSRIEVQPGMSLREVVQQRIAAGTLEDPDRYYSDLFDAVSHSRRWKKVVEMADGRTLAVVAEPIANGGWVSTHQDITETRQREASFRFLFESTPIPMWVWDHETLGFLAVNDAAISQYGYSRDQFLALTINDIRREDSEFSVPRIIAAYPARARDGFTSRHRKADGSMIDVAIYGRPMIHDGRAASLVAIIDVTQRKQAENELRRTRAFLDAVVEHMPAILAVKDTEQRYVLINRAAEACFGMGRQEIIGKRADDIFPAAAASFVKGLDTEVLQKGDLVEVDAHPVETPGHGTRMLTTKKLVLRDDHGAPQYLLSLSEDVTDRNRAERQVAHMARHDTLTDLPNRAAFNEKLAAVFARAAATNATFAVLCVDLDRFKEVNDVFGHSTGDALLCEAARRMREASEGAFLARLGGDEFTLIVEDGVQEAQALAERLLTMLAAEVEIGDQYLRVGMSIGIAVFPADGKDSATLIANADAALYRAKAEGRGAIRFFAAEMDERLRERRMLQHELRSALERSELLLHYQPQARISGEVHGFEALVRWQHPTRGLIPPATFVPLAEESGIIVTIGEWILREACREAASWPQPLQIAVNLSPVQFRHGDLPLLVHRILLETGLSPGRLELEITEGVLIGDYVRALSILRRLKALGVRIAMDDFGTGYSSLSYLQSFPFDKIKIDRTFIASLAKNEHSAAIVRAVIGLGRGLNLPVMAEGVETAEQLAFLAGEHCDEVQGFLVGRPGPIANYAALVGRQKAPRTRPESRRRAS